MDSTKRNFVRLTQLVLDGIATEAERAELARLSAAHPETVTTVFGELMIDNLLKWQSGCIVEELPCLEGSVAGSNRSPSHKSHKTITFWTGMIAATVLIATGLVWISISTNAVDSVIADIIHQSGVNWSRDSSALATNNTVRPGRLSSSSGEYTLQFRDGSTVEVVGSASLEIKSKMLVQLDHGQATANVPDGSTGFTIASALVDVVDQGTQFGISVDDARADVVVFNGKVDVQSNVGIGGGQTRLTQGDCVQIDRLGAIVRVADVRRDVQGRWWTDDRDSGKHVIASVSDNIHSGTGGKTFACYQTTFEGLRDDAIAYSDNPHHQWNGLTADGLPDFLIGADYIKTFNDYRYIIEFQTKVELARPANLYVFFDDRIETPDWLKENFEDTGVDIGVDEGPWLLEPDELKHLSQVDVQKTREADVHTTATGGGNSIDNIFSVWRRRVLERGTVTLGHAGDLGHDRVGFGGKGGRSMYGIAATPLDVAESTPAASPTRSAPIDSDR
jgi:hypothetical protein